jgi:hypothetical protein
MTLGLHAKEKDEKHLVTHTFVHTVQRQLCPSYLLCSWYSDHRSTSLICNMVSHSCLAWSIWYAAGLRLYAWHDGYVRHSHNDCMRLTIGHGASEIDFWCVAYITDHSANQTHPTGHAYRIEYASTTNESTAQQRTTNQSRPHSRYLTSWKITLKQGMALHNVERHRAHHRKNIFYQHNPTPSSTQL